MLGRGAAGQASESKHAFEAPHIAGEQRAVGGRRGAPHRVLVAGYQP